MNWADVELAVLQELDHVEFRTVGILARRTMRARRTVETVLARLQGRGAIRKKVVLRIGPVTEEGFALA